ncbi:MAG TPA: hypothetical protein DER56_02265 [Thermosipho africanus]|nr:hypothetical protein [Thermosipho africanus]
MDFVKYQHVERFGTDEVRDIEFGRCFIFPKIDGTNASMWLDDEICGGSRNRKLTIENDNAGFYKEMKDDPRIIKFFKKYPNHRLYGEWLVPHSLKTYQNDAWRKFYIFDVCLTKDNGILEYLPYEIYQSMLDEFGLDYIPPVGIINNASYNGLLKMLEKTTFLIEDGKGLGEGIVIKNYDFYNEYGRQTWAKIVRNEFKEKHTKAMGANEFKEKKFVEQMIVDDFCTNSFIEKEFEKIKLEKEGWKSSYIGMLLEKIFHELVVEESWNIIKKYKNPTINYKTLNTLVIQKIKTAKSDLFM